MADKEEKDQQASTGGDSVVETKGGVVETKGGVAESKGGDSSKGPEGQQRVKVEIDEKGALTSYANFCRVTGTPEELIIDFGLNAQPYGVPTAPIVVTQRLVTNYYTAKRLLHALSLSVQRHEQAFGVLETDVQKRVVGKPPQIAQTGG